MVTKSQKKLIKKNAEINIIKNKIEDELEKLGLFSTQEEQKYLINMDYIIKSKMILMRSVSLKLELDDLELDDLEINDY